MSADQSRILVLALGNDIMGDDGVGPVAARAVAERFSHVDVIETGEAGLAMLETLAGYDRVLLIDSIATGDHPPGTVLEFGRADFDKVLGPTPHYAGLPEVLQLADHLGLDFPHDIRVLAIEIDPPLDFRESLSPNIAAAVPVFVDRASAILRQWNTIEL